MPKSVLPHVTLPAPVVIPEGNRAWRSLHTCIVSTQGGGTTVAALVSRMGVGARSRTPCHPKLNQRASRSSAAQKSFYSEI